MNTSIKALLNNVIQIKKRYEEIYSKTGLNFNIFSITGMQSDEVKICRVITELLNPKGCHYQKHKYLKLFINNVLKMNIEECEYNNIEVFNEYVIDDNRRIDIVIKSDKYFIPIEVKIYAGDQDRQCDDYYKYAKKMSKEKVKVVYLTLDGHIPSKESAGELTPIKEDGKVTAYEEIKIISFKNEILSWIESCICDIDTIKLAPVREVLIQFQGIIRKLTNVMERDELMETVNEIMMSKESIEAACRVASSIKTAKEKMMEKVFNDIKERMEEVCTKYPIKEENEFNYYVYSDKIKEYYNKKESSYPGINYVCTNIKLKNNLQLWFRIEADDILICGFCLFDTKKKDQFDKWTDENYNEIKSCINNIGKNNDNWWVDWIRLPNDDDAPNFKNEYDDFLNLFDKDYYDKFIDNCMERINDMLSILN